MEHEDEQRHCAVKNPFISRIKLTSIQKLQMVICGILLPLRAGLLLALLAFASFVGFICNIGVSEQQALQPYTGYRRHGQKLMTVLARLFAFVMGYYNIRRKGKLASSAEAPIIVVAPHGSFMDGIFCGVIGHLTYISRIENEHVPILGYIVKLIQPISVQRGERSSREETFNEILRRTGERGAWPNICVFPEGTCTNTQSLISFKPGAFLAGVPVQPVLFKYPKDAVFWSWIAPSTLKQLAYISTKFSNSFEMEFLPVYRPNQEEKQNPILYANNVRNVMAKALGVPTSDHSYEDCFLMTEASLKGLPAESAIVEYHKVNRELGLNLENLKDFFQRFAMIDKNKDGLITFDEFSQYLSDVSTNRVRWIFNKIDQERRGFIDFQSFVYGLSQDNFAIEGDLLRYPVI